MPDYILSILDIINTYYYLYFFIIIKTLKFYQPICNSDIYIFFLLYLKFFFLFFFSSF